MFDFRALVLLLFWYFFCFKVVVTDKLSEVIPNEDVRNLTLDFMELCPQTPLCKVDIFEYKNISFSFFPCCHFCECGEECHEHGTCCPDALDHLYDGEDRLRKCLKLRYTGTFNAYGEDKLIIAACPSTFDDREVVTQCNLDYQDYDINDGYTGFVPVTDTSSRETYKNIACLDCNNGSRTDALYWSVVIGCIFQDANLIWTPRSLNEHLPSDCSVMFKAPDTLPSSDIPTQCTPVIEKCNVTGNMEYVDAKLERYCHSYTSEYKNYYKNVHCALCNGVDRNNVTAACEPPFYAFQYLHEYVLDVPGIVASEQDMEEMKLDSSFRNCTPDIEGALQGSIGNIPCVTRHCPKLTYRIGLECRPLYTSLPSYTVQMTMRFYPKGRAMLSHDFVTSLKYNTENMLHQFRLRKEMNQVFLFPSFDMYVKIDEGPSFGNDNSIKKATIWSPIVIYLELHIQIRSSSRSNVSRLNQDCLDILQADFGERNLFQKEFISPRSGLLRDDLSATHSLSILLGDDQRARFGVTEAAIDIDNKLILHFNKQTTTFGVGPFKSAYLTPLVSCSQVVLDSSRFQRSVETDGSIHVSVLGQRVQLSKIVFEESYAYAVMCEKDFKGIVEQAPLPTIGENRNETSIAAGSVFKGEILFLSYILHVTMGNT